jgi:hypothetical protein
MGIPFKWTKQAKANVSAVLNYTDSLYLRVVPVIQDKNYAKKISAWIMNIYHSAQQVIARKSDTKPSKICLSFDEVWTNLGDIKRDAGRRIKYDKSGNPKRYHPSLPDSAGMERSEVQYAKLHLKPLWSELDSFRLQWEEACQTPDRYAASIKALQGLYQSQLSASKGIKSLADSRIEALGVPRTSAKAVISSKKAQKIATGTYDQKYSEKDILIVATRAEVDLYKVRSRFYNDLDGESQKALAHMSDCSRLAANAEIRLKGLIDATTSVVAPKN